MGKKWALSWNRGNTPVIASGRGTDTCKLAKWANQDILSMSAAWTFISLTKLQILCPIRHLLQCLLVWECHWGSWDHENWIPHPWKHGLDIKLILILQFELKLIRFSILVINGGHLGFSGGYGLRIKCIIIDLNSAYLYTSVCKCSCFLHKSNLFLYPPHYWHSLILFGADRHYSTWSRFSWSDIGYCHMVWIYVPLKIVLRSSCFYV